MDPRGHFDGLPPCPLLKSVPMRQQATVTGATRREAPARARPQAECGCIVEATLMLAAPAALPAHVGPRQECAAPC
eukprot:3335905-Pyramimonas_sp.AAC.1